MNHDAKRTDEALWREEKASLNKNSSPVAHKDLTLDGAKRFYYLKDFQQGFHVKTPDAKGNSEDSRHNNEHQQEGEPHCERDSQQDAQQGVEEELHLKVTRGQT